MKINQNQQKSKRNQQKYRISTVSVPYRTQGLFPGWLDQPPQKHAVFTSMWGLFPGWLDQPPQEHAVFTSMWG
jgi:hypothetical protein